MDFKDYYEILGVSPDAGAAEIKRAMSPHAFRHAVALRIYDKTGDLAVVQAALGHQSITSTLVYARADARRVRAALA